MANGYSMGMTGGVMPNPTPMGTMGGVMPAPLAPFLKNLPLSTATVIVVSESTPNLMEIQNFPVVSRNGMFHIHQDPRTGQRYSMTDDFHTRIPQILSSRQMNNINSTQNFSVNIINDSNINEFETLHSSGKNIQVLVQFNSYVSTLDAIQFQNELFDQNIEAKLTYSKLLPTYTSLMQDISTRLSKNVSMGRIFIDGKPIFIQNQNVSRPVITQIQGVIPTNTYTLPSPTELVQPKYGPSVIQKVPINTYHSSK